MSNKVSVKVKSSHPHNGKMVKPGVTIEVDACRVAALAQEGRIHAPKKTAAAEDKKQTDAK